MTKTIYWTNIERIRRNARFGRAISKEEAQQCLDAMNEDPQRYDAIGKQIRHESRSKARA